MLAKTRVTEVQVYRRSATVTRSGEVSLVAGRNIIYVGGMTGSADTDNVQELLSFFSNAVLYAGSSLSSG